MTFKEQRMRRREFGLSLLTTTATLSLAMKTAWALDSAPVRLVVPFAAGGGNDLYARMYAPSLSKLLQASIVVENRSGASGNIGASYVARSAPDGHTALYASAAIAINPFVLPNMPFDTEQDLLPVTLAVSQPLVMVARKDIGVRDVQGLIDRVRQKTLTLSYGSASPGSISNLIAELLFKQAKADAVGIPFRGAGQMLTALLAGDVQVAFLVYPVAKPFIDQGTLTPIATTGHTPMPQLPDVPTLASQGFPELVADQWHGLFLPAKTPMSIALEFQQAMATTLKDPAIVDRLQADGAAVVGSTPREFAIFFKEELVRWKNIVEQTGLKAN